jgi:nucleotide-binding universal stress UspA family protein
MKRVLVPVDKSEAAEEVFPLVAALAKSGATVRLVHVDAVPQNVIAADGHTAAYADQELQSREAEWADYVCTTKTRLGVELEGAIRFGDPTTEILAEAEACGADTIVVSTSTSCAVKRALSGSVAGAMLRRAPIGVLMYRPAAV